MHAVTACLKRLAYIFLCSHEMYFIYSFDVAAAAPAIAPAGFAEADESTFEREELIQAEDEIRGLKAYAGEDALGFVLYESGRPACLAWFWYGARYREQRNFWPLAADEAKLVQIVTNSSMRGLGHAPRLMALSLHALAAKGFRRVYARVWCTNRPSVQAFRKAGWRRVALVLTARFRGFRKEFRIVLGAKPRPDNTVSGATGLSRPA